MRTLRDSTQSDLRGPVGVVGELDPNVDPEVALDLIFGAAVYRRPGMEDFAFRSRQWPWCEVDSALMCRMHRPTD